MRRANLLGAAGAMTLAALWACSGGNGGSGFDDPTGSGGDGGGGGGGGSGNGAFDGGGGKPPSFEAGGGPTYGDGATEGSVTVSTTIYAHTDDTLYSMDPQTKAITMVGKFAGTSGATNDKSITDLAVNAKGEVYVNSESVIYKAALPQSAGGTVNLTKLASISLQTGQRFYALAFVPVGVFGPNEALVGGDGNGELWSIDAQTGATKDLGNFGTDPNNTSNVLGLSGDLVFYLDANNKPTGMATVRSCTKGTSTCSNTSDYLVGVDMTNLAQAYSSGTPATTLLGGIYGGSSSSTGSGIGFGSVYGLGAWEGSVYGFSRGASGTTPKPPDLLALDTQTGKGSVVSNSFTFTNGWSGAGVTTTVTISVPPPPPPPPQPK